MFAGGRRHIRDGESTTFAVNDGRRDAGRRPMSEPRRRPDGSTSRRQQRVQPERQIMLHEVLAILWSVYVIYRFLELSVDEPMNRLEYYTQ